MIATWHLFVLSRVFVMRNDWELHAGFAGRSTVVRGVELLSPGRWPAQTFALVALSTDFRPCRAAADASRDWRVALVLLGTNTGGSRA